MAQETMGFPVMVVIFIVSCLTRTFFEIFTQGDMQGSPLWIKLVVGVAMFGMWISWFNLCQVDPLRVEIPAPIAWMGFGLFVAGVVLFMVALVQLIAAHRKGEPLVTGGVFALFRHPMYTGFLFWLVGYPLYTGAGSGFGLALLGIANVLVWRWREEARLKQIFSEYKSYQRHTWF